MRPDIVVDIGNTRIKWGRVAPSRDAIAQIVSLPTDESAWAAQLAAWSVTGPLTWALASVQPARCDHLKAWLTARGDGVVLITKAAQLPLVVGLPEPDKVGIDRLLDAVAAKHRLEPGRAAVLIDAGSAVTIDYLDETHAFRGGLIAPGLDLMAKALNNYTALLPLVDVSVPIPALPANRTTTAMQAGIFLSVSGCIREAVRLYSALTSKSPRVFYTGGQSPLLVQAMGLTPSPDWELWPVQTLMGILYTAEGLS